MAATGGDRASVMVVENNAAVARQLIDALEGAAYRVWHATSGSEARGQLERARPDLIVLDLLLPDIDGLVLCSALKTTADVPIIVCSASSRRGDATLALKLGADDFVRQPFDVEDLLARIEAVLRRVPPRRSAPGTPPALEIRVGTLVVDAARRRVTLGHDQVALTPIELRLLTVLALQAEQVLSRDHLAKEVWGYASASNGRTIDVHIRRLRLKLAAGRMAAPAIVSVRGMGYRLTATEAVSSAA